MCWSRIQHIASGEACNKELLISTTEFLNVNCYIWQIVGQICEKIVHFMIKA